MQIDDCFYFGRVIKTHGIKGGISIYIDTDNPIDYQDISMFFLEINKKLVPYFIDALQLQHNKAYVDLVDVDTVEQAGNLCGKSIYLPLELLPRLKDNQFYFHELDGYEIIDHKYGSLGKLAQVLEYPNQALFQLFVNKKEVLIPIHDDVIKRVDRKNKTISIAAPEGLIEMYLA